MSITYRLILCLLIASHLSMSLKSNDLCSLVQEECKGSYDSSQKYEIKCQLADCNGKYPYKCGQDKCSIDQKSCDSYLYFTLASNSYKYKNDMDKFAFIRFNLKTMHNMERKKYKFFNENVQNCTVRFYEYKPSDVCLIGNYCLEKRKIFKAYGSNYLIKKANCTCTGAHSFHCDKNYCTNHKSACDYLKSKPLKQLPGSATIKPCLHKNTIINRKFYLL